MRELSIFVNESGDSAHQSKYYLLTLVFHDQSQDITNYIDRYENAIQMAGLPDVPFHMGPLLNGHRDYKHLTIDERRKLLVHFLAFTKLAPIRYKTFIEKVKPL